MNSPLILKNLCEELQLADPETLSPDSAMIAKDWCVYENESQIRLSETLYLFTWSPNPEDLPDADFSVQHDSCISTITNLLHTVRCGMACVEATIMANPHYHGWYQNEPSLTCARVAMIKVMKKMGNLKITKSKGHVKIHSYVKQANCLWYYKKELLDEGLYVNLNPVTIHTVPNVNMNEHYNFFVKVNSRQSVADIENKISNAEFYRNFYTNSIN